MAAKPTLVWKARIRMSLPTVQPTSRYVSRLNTKTNRNNINRLGNQYAYGGSPRGIMGYPHGQRLEFVLSPERVGLQAKPR